MANRNGGFIGQDGLNAPDEPTNVSGTDGDASSDISFTAPLNAGGAAITGYRVTDSTGVHGASGSSSPITVTGLTNGTSYTFRVWAINPFGWSSPSGASGSVTPQPGQYAIVAQDTSGTFYADRFNVATTGNTAAFGTLTSSPTRSAHAQSTTRAIFMGGGGGAAHNSITFITYTTSGAGSDFGELTTIANEQPAGASSSTRSIRAGGGNAGGATNIVYNVIDYITSATTGNATDFGDLTEEKAATGGCSSSTRMLAMGGYVPPFGGASQRNTIEYITISSLGNATDFGDLLFALNNGPTCASETRAVLGGGFNNTGFDTNIIQYVTIATTGNAIDFGDLVVGMSNRPDACSGTTRGVFNDGNTLNYITIATTGNAADFGDISPDADGGGATMACGSTPAVQ